MTRYALTFTAPHQVRVDEQPLPRPAADQLLVASFISAISSGSEMLVYRGQMPAGMAADETIAALGGSLDYPLAYGYAVVGEVIDVGAAVDGSWRGRLVFSFQPHASHFVARPAEVLPLPEGMPPATAVFLPNMETAVSLVMDGQPLIGEQVAVLGQGVVGLLTTALLGQFPLAALVTFDRYAQRREWSRRLGAGASLVPDAPDGLAHLQGERPYAGADLTYELTGNPAALDAAIGLTGYNGRVVVGSWYGAKRAPLALGGKFHRAHMRLISSQVSHLAPQWSGRWSKTRRLRVAWEMLAQQRPEQLITHRFALQDAAQAYRLLDEEPETAVQVVFVYE